MITSKMKKRPIILALILFSCDNDPVEEEVNPFLGTWEAASGYRDVFTEILA